MEGEFDENKPVSGMLTGLEDQIICGHDPLVALSADLGEFHT